MIEPSEVTLEEYTAQIVDRFTKADLALRHELASDSTAGTTVHKSRVLFIFTEIIWHHGHRWYRWHHCTPRIVFLTDIIRHRWYC